MVPKKSELLKGMVVIGEKDGTVDRKRKPGKKRRVILRRRAQSAAEAKVQREKGLVERERAEREKRTRRNREKKVKRKEKEKAAKGKVVGEGEREVAKEEGA